jgi:hypothetical protein
MTEERRMRYAATLLALLFPILASAQPLAPIAP